jgi:hypothetical protein
MVNNKKHRVGDLVSYLHTFKNNKHGVLEPINIYAKILNIIDEHGNSHDEYDIITKKVKVLIKPLVYEKDLSVCDMGDLLLDPRSIYGKEQLFSFNQKEEIKSMESKIELLQRKIEFLNKNENRIDKLNKILDVSE